jgi:hypothetical protein
MYGFVILKEIIKKYVEMGEIIFIKDGLNGFNYFYKGVPVMPAKKVASPIIINRRGV